MANAEDRHTNRLVNEKSPYLLQHAHNPVDWYPWGEEAFSRARNEDKPVFLSVGYSTCHWCHVMEEESFSDPSMARIMNKHFVCIKVDREERPDVDRVYMSAVVAITGQGGWPLTVFLTPEKRPFFGGTYFPPEDRMGMSGLKTVLLSVTEAWTNRREHVLRSSETLLEIIQKKSGHTDARRLPLGEQVLRSAYEYFSENFDSRSGGFGQAPKFPSGHSLSFLLRYWKRTGSKQALDMVEKTLSAMARGGIYDHLGGGFHRYSTDQEWHVPHFEKMLYDQAVLSRAYLEAYQVTKNSEYARTAGEVLDYVLRDMTGSDGGFYSAEDADSAVSAREPEKSKEGAFYVWSKSEIIEALGEEDAETVSFHFSVEAEGNVVHDPHGQFGGKNILHEVHTIEETAERFRTSHSQMAAVLKRAKERLFSVRSERPRPHLDDKVLVDWNGLMIAGLAFGSRVLEEHRYLEAAQDAADFVLEHLLRKDGRLLHTYRDGQARVLGTIEDYAFFVFGLFELYEASFDLRYLEEAKRLTREMLRLFWDEDGGGFFFTASDAEPLPVRQKEVHDGAFPSGNSVATLDLLLLGRLTAEKGFEEKAKTLVETFSDDITRAPSAFTQLLSSLDFSLGPSKEIVIVGEKEDQGTRDLLTSVHRRFLPNKVVAVLPPSGEERERVIDLIQFLKNYHLINDQATVYVCQDYACQLPTTSRTKLEFLLDK
ncbi:MAG: hypothetical protein AMJ46_12250 [Latescibacteria bacterium DG_63]|nr:MAG: hypothetical protein AMJ46_12250 [Latescibacteria bacterium DG_63]